MYWTNYHSHTLFSDGSHSPEHYVVSAIEKGMLAYGFSGHAPVPFNTDWTIKADNLAEYLSVIDQLKVKYESEILLLKSLEIDYLPGSPMCWDSTRKPFGLDYVIGSVHFIGTFADGTAWNIDYTKELFDLGVAQIYKGNLQKAIEDYYKLSVMMVQEMKPDIVGHLDKVKMFCIDEFDQNEQWYKNCVIKLLDEIQKSGSIIEINTRGLYKGTLAELYPSPWILTEAYRRNIPVTICSDSHHPSELILGFDVAAQQLLQAGYSNVAVWEKGGWVQKPFSVESGIVA